MSSCFRSHLTGGRPFRQSRPNRFEQLEKREMLSGAPPTVIGVYAGSTEWTPAFYDYLNSTSDPDFGYRIPTGTSAQVKSLPWFNVDKLSIRFSEDVNVDIGDFSLSGVNATSFAFEHFFYDALSHVATWTLASPLPKNSYQIDLNGNGLDPVHDLEGNILDGEWANNSDTFPSGNGVAGGDFAFNFKVMPGDVNQNAAVENMDVSAVNGRIGSITSSSNYSAFADVDGSGSIDSQDAQDVQSRIWSTYPSQGTVGLNNDAPSSTGGEAIEITDAMGNITVSLHQDFQDVESADSQLIYQLIDNTNPQLFDAAAIDSTTGSLILNSAMGESGRSSITVRATDVAGLWTTATYVVDVNYTNQAPSLDFDVQFIGSNTFEVIGMVLDDDAVLEGLYVEFCGAFDVRASVAADGSFSFCIIVPEEDWGDVTAIVTDFQGATSLAVERTVTVT